VVDPPEPARAVSRGDVGSDAGGPAPGNLDRIATVPNLLSLLRIILIPVFVILLLHHGTEEAGLILLAAVVATDWIDGYVARRTAQVSNVGKLLDPVADRLALMAALLSLLARDAFPLWAALTVIIRDGAILVAGLLLLLTFGVRIDVRWIGKIATFALMCAIPMVAWGNFGLFLHGPVRIAGWALFWIGIVPYYLATFAYATDMRKALNAARAGPHTL
jgi:cardiolipin synthase